MDTERINRGYLFSLKLNKWQQRFVSTIAVCFHKHLYPIDRTALTAAEMIAPLHGFNLADHPTSQELGDALKTLKIQNRPYRGTNRWNLNQVLNAVLEGERLNSVDSPPCPPHQKITSYDKWNKANSGNYLVSTSAAAPVYYPHTPFSPKYLHSNVSMLVIPFIEPIGTDMVTNSNNWIQWYGSETKHVDLLHAIREANHLLSSSLFDLVNQSPDVPTPCLIAKGIPNEDGYIQLSNPKHLPTHYAHRLIGLCKNRYLDHSEDRLEVHHVCRNRSCINPDHLHSVPPNQHKQIHLQIGDDHPVTRNISIPVSVSANDNHGEDGFTGSTITMVSATSVA